jgi:hypothetical protein
MSSSGDVPQHISSPRRQYASSGHPLREPSAPVKQATKAPVSPSKSKLATTSSTSTVSKPSLEPILTSSAPHSSKIIRTLLKPKLSLPSPASLLRSTGSPRRVMPRELITFEESQRIGPVCTVQPRDTNFFQLKDGRTPSYAWYGRAGLGAHVLVLAHGMPGSRLEWQYRDKSQQI